MEVTKDDVLAARLAAGLTQRQAGELLNSGRRTWQDWEYGHTPMGVPEYRYFCHLAGLARIPFGTIQPEEKPARQDRDRLAGEIAEMLTHYSAGAEVQR